MEVLNEGTKSENIPVETKTTFFPLPKNERLLIFFTLQFIIIKSM